MSASLGPNDRALLRFNGKLWGAYVVLDWKYEGRTHYGATPVDALNNAMQAAAALRELGTPNVVPLPTPAEFAELMESAS